MSADNTTSCPACTQKRRARVVELSAAIADESVTLSRAELLELARERDNLANQLPKATLREYREVHGAATGTVTVEYGAICTACGFEAGFSYQHALLV